MQQDGEPMSLYEHDQVEPERRRAEVRRQQHDGDWWGARRAVEVGHTRNVEAGAVLHLQRLAGNAGVASLVEDDAEQGAATPQRSPVLDVVGRGGGSPLPA